MMVFNYITLSPKCSPKVSLMYCAFSADGFCVDTERIYSFHDNTAVFIMERDVSNPGTDVSPCTTFLTKGGKTYIWYQHEICTGSIETVEKNSMVVIMTYYDDFWDDINYKLDEKPCTKEELNTAIDNFTRTFCIYIKGQGQTLVNHQ